MALVQRFTAAASTLLWASAALADPQATSTFVPVQVQDALASRTGSLTLQGVGVYTRDPLNKTGPDLLNLSPTIKLGAAKGLQLDLTAPYAVGNQTSASQGSSGVDAFYQFNTPAPNFPTLAIQAGYQVPYGQGAKSNQYFVRGLLTQWLGPTDKSPRLHLNLDYTQVTSPSKTGRRDIPDIGVAYSQLLSDSTALVVDVVHGAKSSKGQNQTFLDAGVKWEISDLWSISGGAGAGVGQQSPDFRVIVAVQRAFQLF